jgi:hypothetical protein
MGRVSERTDTATIRFETAALAVDESTILRLPENASQLLPSRGQVAVRGSINDVEFRTVVEPDGMKGHWIRLDRRLRKATGISAGDPVRVAIEVVSEWPEPDVPSDLSAALSGAPDEIRAIWQDITPMARWEWVRWVNATPNPATRERRVEVAVSTMNDGKRRPCCFDRSACTDPALAKNGKLRGLSSAGRD